MSESYSTKIMCMITCPVQILINLYWWKGCRKALHFFRYSHYSNTSWIRHWTKLWIIIMKNKCFYLGLQLRQLVDATISNTCILKAKRPKPRHYWHLSVAEHHLSQAIRGWDKFVCDKRIDIYYQSQCLCGDRQISWIILTVLLCFALF